MPCFHQADTGSNSPLIEVLLPVGHDQMIAGFLNSAGLTPEAPIEETLFYRRMSR